MTTSLEGISARRDYLVIYINYPMQARPGLEAIDSPKIGR